MYRNYNKRNKIRTSRKINATNASLQIGKLGLKQIKNASLLFDALHNLLKAIHKERKLTINKACLKYFSEVNSKNTEDVKKKYIHETNLVSKKYKVKLNYFVSMHCS